MKFKVPNTSHEFSIPDYWWQFSEMNKFKINGYKYYPYPTKTSNVQVVEIFKIEPPSRNKNIPPFKKYKLVPILMSFISPECSLPPVEVQIANDHNLYKYKVKDGYHRFYASIAVGYTKLPIIITDY